MSRQSKADNIVEGIGWDVTLFLIPALVLGSVAIYHIYQFLKPKIANLFREGEPVAEPRMYREAECPICLEPARLQMSATCGHVFCSTCIFMIYDRQRQRILCPNCRKPVTTMFKLFQDSDPPTQQQKTMANRIKNYNMMYDDNRGIFRSLTQLPYLWGHIRNNITNPEFYGYIFRNSWKFRILLLLVIYIISPFDILPESVMGAIGLIDDIFILVIVLALIAQASMAFLRRR